MIDRHPTYVELQTRLAEAESRLAALGAGASDVSTTTSSPARPAFESRYHELFENLLNAVMIFKAVDDGNDFIIQEMNRAAEELDKVSRRNLIGRHLSEVCPEAREQGFLVTMKRVFQTGDSEKSIPFQIVSPESSPSWRESLMFRLTSGEVVVIYRDLTELIKAREESIAKESRMRRIFQVANVAMAMVEDRVIIKGNDRFFEMVGYKPEEILNKPALLLYATESEYNFAGNELFNQMEREGRGVIETRSRRKNGEIIDIILTASRLDPDDPESVVITSSIDITERKRRDNELARFQAAIEQTEEMIVILDTAGRIEYVNPAFEKSTGYTRQEAVGRSPEFLKSGQHDEEFYEQMRTTIFLGKSWQGQLVNKRKDGSFYTEYCTISPVVDADKQIIAFVEVKHDVTKSLEMEMQLRESQRMESIGILAGGVAHEINNPITGIMNYAELIKDETDPNSRARDFAGEIIKEADRVADIVKNLLTFARQEKQSYSPARLIDIVNSTLSLVQAVMRHDNITLEIDVPEDLPKIKCRSQQIQQVLLNLLTNARDALNEKFKGYDPNKRIAISSTPVEINGKPYIRTSVEDKGTGITPEVMRQIFNPFYTTKPRDKTTGLGLAVSHGIMAEHGGSISVESEPGEWTRFHIDLKIDNGGPFIRSS